MRYTVHIDDSEANSEQREEDPVPITDTTAPQLQSATVDGHILTLAYGETLDNTESLDNSLFSVNVNDAPRTVLGTGVGGSDVTLLLNPAVETGDTVTVGYTPPTGASDFRIRDTSGNAAQSFSGESVSNITPEPPNNPATGTPTIAGTRQVGGTLTASTSDIDDADGIQNAVFTFQWLADGADINGATGSTHTLTSDEQGKAVSVTVSFTDDASNDEIVTSAQTEPIAGAPLTSSSHDVPPSHDGQSDFTFELRLSENIPSLSYKTLKYHAFTVTGGSLENARRLDRPRNVRWEITVSPDNTGTVTIVLPTTTDCNVQGAICTDDDRMLSNRLEVTVPGP